MLGVLSTCPLGNCAVAHVQGVGEGACAGPEGAWDVLERVEEDVVDEGGEDVCCELG